MREREVKSFFAAEPQPLVTDVQRVGINVAAGLQWGPYGELVGRKRRAVKSISKTLLLNQALLGIEMPIVVDGSGSFVNKGGQSVGYLAFSVFYEARPVMILSRPFLDAHVDPNKNKKDAHLRTTSIETVVAHECFHIKQHMETPWKLVQDMRRASLDGATWATARSEQAAQLYSKVYVDERTRKERERNTLIFLQNMGIDPIGITEQVGQVAALGTNSAKI